MTPYALGGPQLPVRMLVRSDAPGVRIGDAERDQAVAALGDHFAAGRLSREEFDERSEQALGARLRSDLQPLFADLPVAPSAVVERRPNRPPVLFALLPVLLMIAVVSAVAAQAPWMIWGLLWVFLFTGFFGRRRYPSGPGPWR